MTKTICDICGKEMPTASPRLRKRMEIFDDEDTFCISSNGLIWDICDECRASFTRWKLMRKAEMRACNLMTDVKEESEVAEE